MSSKTGMQDFTTVVSGHFDDETLEEIKRYFVALTNLHRDLFILYIDAWYSSLAEEIPIEVDISEEDYTKYICDYAQTIADYINAMLLSSKSFEIAIEDYVKVYVRLKNDHTATYKVRMHCE